MGTCHGRKYVHAMEENMASIDQNQTWSLTNLPIGKWPIHNKWVYIREIGFDCQSIKLKVKGFEQIDIDYE
jgi:hypothetical protein